MIPLGTVVRDRLTGFTGVTENRATFMYGCDRYCIQPRVGTDGKMPDSAMIDEPQLEIVEDEPRVMVPSSSPAQLVEMGQVVNDPVRDQKGTVIGRAVYLNGCARVLIQPKYNGKEEPESWWVDEPQVEPVNKVFGKKKVTKEPGSDRKIGGPAPSSSKY